MTAWYRGSGETVPRRVVVAMAALVVAAVTLGACGGDDEITTTSSPTTTTSTSTEVETSDATGTTPNGLPVDIAEAREFIVAQIAAPLSAQVETGALTQAQADCVIEQSEQILTDEKVEELQNIAESEIPKEGLALGVEAGEACKGT